MSLAFTQKFHKVFYSRPNCVNHNTLNPELRRLPVGKFHGKSLIMAISSCLDISFWTKVVDKMPMAQMYLVHTNTKQNLAIPEALSPDSSGYLHIRRPTMSREEASGTCSSNQAERALKLLYVQTLKTQTVKLTSLPPDKTTHTHTHTHTNTYEICIR